MASWTTLTRSEKFKAQEIVQRAWSADIAEATVSQVAKDLDGWEGRVERAERAAA